MPSLTPLDATNIRRSDDQNLLLLMFKRTRATAFRSCDSLLSGEPFRSYARLGQPNSPSLLLQALHVRHVAVQRRHDPEPLALQSQNSAEVPLLQQDKKRSCKTLLRRMQCKETVTQQCKLC